MAKARNERKLTKRIVDAFAAIDGKRTRLWDTEIKGFCLLAYPTGRKVYTVGYVHRGRYRWCNIGQHGTLWTADTARDQARSILGRVAAGEDPAARDDLSAREKILTVRALVEIYLKEGPRDKPDKRASSWATDKSNLGHARRLIGNRLIDELKARDISKFQNDVLNGKSTAPSENGGLPARGGHGAASPCGALFFSDVRVGCAAGIYC